MCIYISIYIVKLGKKYHTFMIECHVLVEDVTYNYINKDVSLTKQACVSAVGF